MLPFVQLKKGKEHSVLRKHPWIFSGAVQKSTPNIAQGHVVDVLQYDGRILGRGHYQHGGSIVVRILTFDDRLIDAGFWNYTLQKAYDFRQKLGLISDQTNAFRLIHGEGDLLPGLVVDIYANIAVIQCHSIGMYLQRKEIANAILLACKIKNMSIYCKAKDTLPAIYANQCEDGFIEGELSETTVLENGHRFTVNVVEGQKTGFFLDQRENRFYLSQLAQGKRILNTFCYTGGFSVYALGAGAVEVDSVDSSGKAMILTDKNVALNQVTGIHQSFTENVLTFFQKEGLDPYDIVVVDPPAFAKSLTKRHNAIQAYKRLNMAALQKVKAGGFLFTFSCSQVVNTQLFYDTIVAAGLESGRHIRVVRHLSQGADHPVNLFHPEGHYLKGLLVYVE